MSIGKFENSEIDTATIDSASPSDGPDRVLSVFNSVFPVGYFDSLFQEGCTHTQHLPDLACFVSK